MKRFLIAITVAVLAVFLSVSLRPGDGAESAGEMRSLILSSNMTVKMYLKENRLDAKIAEQVFDAPYAEVEGRLLLSFPVSLTELEKKTQRALVLQQEHSSKNFAKIKFKFVLWFMVLAGAFVLVVKRLTTTARRIAVLGSSVLLFGVLFGSDPNPMATVNDMIVLLGRNGTFFPPRLVALTLFLLTVILANKFICSWGCQFGTLQDLLYRIMRKDRTGGGVLLPFVWTNAFRVAVFVMTILMAFGFGLNMLGAIDPFKIFTPKVLTMGGMVFLGILLLLSLYVYRPWCTLFCPFGFVGWVAERFSIFRIRVKQELCTGCGSCEKACPSGAMSTYLHTPKKHGADCYSCGSCMEACPAQAVEFAKK